jgi:hypothetical protein
MAETVTREGLLWFNVVREGCDSRHALAHFEKVEVSGRAQGQL